MHRIAAFLGRPPVRDRIFLAALGAFFFVPFLGSAHLFDWDEVNFAEAAREMIVTGDYFRVQIDYQPFWEKPPLFFWLQALSMTVFGINEFGARFVNAACGILTLLVVYSAGLRLRSRRLGMFWALAFLGSILPHILFKSGVIDPVFNLLIFGGICFLSRTTRGNGPGRHSDFALAGLLIGLAVLTKGPVAFLVAALCLGTYYAIGRFRAVASFGRLSVFVGCAAAVSFVFYGLETLAHGTWFMREFVKYHLRLLGTSEAGHAEPFYYHFFVLLFGCFPASLLAVKSFFIRDEQSAAAADFRRWMLIVFWVVLVLFSIVKTKTVLYSSLAYFPLTFLAACHVEAVLDGRVRWTKAQSVALSAFGIVIGLLFAAVPVLMVNRAWLAARIPDAFSAASVAKDVGWTGWESLAGIGYAAAVVASAVIIARNPVRRGFFILFLAAATGISALMMVLVGKVENHMQRSPIEFYKTLSGRDVYVTAMFKTYADLFYTRKKPLDNPKGYDREWLLTGPIDKPAFFVARLYQAERMAKYPDLEMVKSEGGFLLYRRGAED